MRAENVLLETGEACWLIPDETRRDEWHWSISGDNGETGTTYDRDYAIRVATWTSARRMWHARPVAGFSVADAIALDRADRSEYTRTLKRLIVASTGLPAAEISVRGHRGTASSWVGVYGTTDRARTWIAALFGRCAPGEALIPPTRGYRAWHAARAAGLDGSGIELADHGWD